MLIKHNCVPLSHTALWAAESGSTKAQASKNTALSLVRQLYHLKNLEPFTGEKKKKKGDEVCPNIILVPLVSYESNHSILLTWQEPSSFIS